MVFVVVIGTCAVVLFWGSVCDSAPGELALASVGSSVASRVGWMLAGACWAGWLLCGPPLNLFGLENLLDTRTTCSAGVLLDGSAACELAAAAAAAIELIAEALIPN